MNGKIGRKPLRALFLALTALAMLAVPSFGATVNLVVEEALATMPGGESIPMWGYFLDTGQACNPAAPPVWDIGPQITVGPTDTTLVVNLRNCLDSAATSLVISGQGLPVDGLGNTLPPATMTDPQNRVRVTSFTQNATAAGGTMTYVWNNLKDGTYLYHSGTHAALQQPMGLYGAVKVEQTPGQAYGVSYQQEQVLLYSEIDPTGHALPASAKPLNYKPKYFLINGQPFTAGSLPAGNVNQATLLRFLNAGLKTHVPTLLNGYMMVLAEDGNAYPYARDQYSVALAAGMSMDALFTPQAAGTYALFDRSLHLTTAGASGGGMLTSLDVGTGLGPTASNDAYSADEDTVLNVDGTVFPGILANDTGTAPFTANLVSDVGNGVLGLNLDGTFTYTPNPDFSGADFFTYKANDGTYDSNLAMVRITVNPSNDPPVAANDAYQAVAGTTLTIAAPGVLGNDSDLDGDPLTAVLDAGPAGGILALAANGSFAYTPNPGTTNDSFSYFANDGTTNSLIAATVGITVMPPISTAPVAVDDAATTQQNVPVTILLLANDSDAEGDINPASVVITNLPNRGGTVQNMLNGTVIYTPKRGFKGTDVFTYTVRDLADNLSNQATVRVNVVK